MKQKKYKVIDLFAGCGGLSEGFAQSGNYIEVAAVEWLKPQVNTLRHRLFHKWKREDTDEIVMHFDIQREVELFNGWTDSTYGSNKGLDYHVNKSNGIDMIIGGPPCQAYSIAGRVRDKNRMCNDYRNYLFEHYLNIVNRYRPKVFVFENVPGILSAKPNGVLITNRIYEAFQDIGYDIITDLKKYAQVDASEYGVPQKRKRVFIIGIDKRSYTDTQQLLLKFYTEILPKYKTQKKITVKDSISDLPPCTPVSKKYHSKKTSHTTPETTCTWHIPRYCNPRDMSTYKLLAEDIRSGKREYNSKKITELYREKVGSSSPIHRYHVLDPDQPSTTIIAHLYKDGHRYIHYDPNQARSITVREAARLQSFDDDFDFIGSRGDAYQMIGNAVPPRLARSIAEAIYELIELM